MAIPTLVQSGSNNGTATPATPGSLTTTAGNLLVLLIAAIGTSPTIGLPGGWSSINANNGSTLTYLAASLPNNAGGATNPSSVLGGTVTGWVAVMLEFNAVGTNANVLANQGIANGSIQNLTNCFSNSKGQTLPNSLFLYCVARATATISAPVTGLLPFRADGIPASSLANGWSSSIQPQAGVHGISMDTYWGTNIGIWPCSFPTATGTLSSSVATFQQTIVFNAAGLDSYVTHNNTVVSGSEGMYVPQFNQGMIGG